MILLNNFKANRSKSLKGGKKYYRLVVLNDGEKTNIIINRRGK
jgi:hypothetical protein